jgi:outer membrane protein assembly factor BamB
MGVQGLGMSHISVPSALDAGNNKVLVVGGYEYGAVMIKVEKKADGNYGVTELFKHNEFGDHTKPPILYNGYFYAQFTTNSKRDGLACMDMNGKVLWKTMRAPLFDKGSMILADGVILATDGRNSLYVIEPSPSGFKPLATAEVLKPAGNSDNNQPTTSRMGGVAQNWAPIALADGKLLIRDQNRLLCVRVAK